MPANHVLLNAPGSAAPTNRHWPSHTSTHVWLPLLSAHSGVPATRAGTPTARQASTSRIDSPEQDAKWASIDSNGLWSGLGRLVAWYFTSTALNTSRFSTCAASPADLPSLTSGGK